MKKTKKQLEEIVKETDDRNARLSIELRAARQLNDELRETLSESNNIRNELVEDLTNTNRSATKQSHRTVRSFRASAIERTTWKDLYAAELGQRAEKTVLVNDLRTNLKEALSKLTRLQSLVRTLNKNRVQSNEGVYVKDTDLLELVYDANILDHFINDPDVEQLLDKNERVNTLANQD